MVAWPFRIAAARKNTSKELRMEVPKELTMEEVLAAIRKTFADEETEENQSTRPGVTLVSPSAQSLRNVNGSVLT
jgi:hypothetical protein